MFQAPLKRDNTKHQETGGTFTGTAFFYALNREMPVERPGSPVKGFFFLGIVLYHPGTENAVEGKIKGLFLCGTWEKGHFEYILGVLCRKQPSFYRGFPGRKRRVFHPEEIGRNRQLYRKPPEIAYQEGGVTVKRTPGRPPAGVPFQC